MLAFSRLAHGMLDSLRSYHGVCTLVRDDRADFRPTQDASLDTFKLTYLLPPVAVFALLFNYNYSPFELTWSFSIWLESVAILPQLFMLQRTGEAEAITTHYLAALGLYRGLYIPNWMYR
jgi:ER lumen protein retaining receptor